MVDAGMRQLNQYGWMCSRVRQITSQFLTKYLLIDWRYGERYFMRQQIDADFASNNGGWQIAAFTGPSTHPSSWRFNPVAQGRSFDPNGDWIRRYVPELQLCNKIAIHEPWRAPTLKAYPPPIVNPEMALLRLHNFFKAIPWKR